MRVTKLTRFKYGQIVHRDDVTTFPLMYGLVGLNNKIYVSLGSYGFSKGDETYNSLRKNFSEEDLRFGCLVRLFEVHLVVRDHNASGDDEWKTHVLDFKDVYAKVKEFSNKIDGSIDLHMSLHDSGNKTDRELGVLQVPLGSEVFKNAANYANQEIERFKMDNFMSNLSESVQLKQFIDIF